MNNSFIETPKKYSAAINKIKIQCKCGRKVVVPVFVDKQLCSWCGHYVYRNKCLEFKEKLRMKMREIKC